MRLRWPAGAVAPAALAAVPRAALAAVPRAVPRPGGDAGRREALGRWLPVDLERRDAAVGGVEPVGTALPHQGIELDELIGLCGSGQDRIDLAEVVATAGGA